MEHTFYMLLLFFLISVVLVLSINLATMVIKRRLTSMSDKDTDDFVEHDKVHRLLAIASVASIWFCISILFTLYNKILMQYLFGGQFDYPILNTSIHMIIKFLISRLYFFIFTVNCPNINDIPRGLLLWIGMCTAADVALSNIAVVHLSISLYTTIKASVLIFCYLWYHQNC